MIDPRRINQREVVKFIDERFPLDRRQISGFMNSVGDMVADTIFANGNLFNAYSGQNYPRVNITENESSLTIRCAVPGLNRNDIGIQTEGYTITVSGTDITENKENFLVKEIRTGSFSRTFKLHPGRYDIDSGIAATLDKGVLTITVKRIGIPALSGAKTIRIQE